MITVQELIDEEDLGLTPLAGTSGVTRQVSWAHSAEIPDVSVFLSGGELILSTGLGFPEKAEQQLDYLQSLFDVGAAALGLGERRPELAPEFLARADELGMPILHTAWAVPYSRIARFVASRNSENYQRNLELQVRILEVLRWQSDHGVGAREVLDRLERLTKTRLSVAYEDGSPVIPGISRSPEPSDASTAGADQQEPRDNVRRLRLPVATPEDAFLIVQADHAGFFALGGALQQLTSAVSVLVANHLHELEFSRRFQAELFSAYLGSGAIPRGSLRTLRSLGFSQDEHALVLAVAIAHDERRRESLASYLQSNLTPALVLAQQEELIVLTAEPCVDVLRKGIERFHLVGGVSAAFEESGDLHVHLGQARWAARYGHFDESLRLVRFADVKQFNPWLNLDPSAMDQVIEHVLGALLKYDEAHGGDLVATLQAFFENNRSFKPTAEKLVIHTQTLRYRLKRVQEISGRDLDDTQNVAELWWALSMLNARSASHLRAATPVG